MILRSRIFQIIWLILFALALLFYFRWHPPLRAVASNLAPLFLAFAHFLAVTGLGWPLARVLLRSGSKMDAAIEFFVSFAFGVGLTGVWSFILGLLGMFHPLLFALWEAAGGVLFLFAFLQWRRAFFWEQRTWNIWDITGAAILTLFLVALIPFVVAPDISTDSIAYHLLIPKLYLMRGEIYHLPLFVEAYYPSLVEYNYLPLLIWSNEIVCKSFHFWIGIAVLFFISLLIRKMSPGSGRLLAPALFLSMPVTAIHIGWAWNDFLYTLFVLLSLYYLFAYHESDKTTGRNLLISGLLAGLASWTKYTFVLYFFTAVLFFFFGYRRWKWRPHHFLHFAIGIACVAPFWLLQNWMFTENPFYPFLNRIFQSPYWTEHADRFFHNALRHWEIAEWKWWTYLTFPFHIAMKSRLVDIQTGILPLVLLPLLFIRSQTSGVRFLKYYVALSIFVWLFIHTENRSLFSVFAIFFCVTAIALERFEWRTIRVRNAIAAGILLVSCTNLFYASLTTYHLFDPFRYFFGRESASQYRSRLSESQQVFDYVNNARDAGTILLVSTHVPYYLEPPSLFSSFADPPVAEVLSSGARSSIEIAEKLRKLNVTHVILNRAAYQKENVNKLYSWSEKERLLFEEFLLKRCEPLIRYDSDYVFRLR